jgi:hypothetical protein
MYSRDASLQCFCAVSQSFTVHIFRFLVLETGNFEKTWPINSRPIKSVNRPISD